MGAIRRLLGLLVMVAGILGLVISLAGLVGVWYITPTISTYATSTIDTLHTSVTTSQKVMQVTGQALSATVDSVDALSEMLGTTALTVQDTQPVLTQLDTIMGETLPSTLESTANSLKTAQEAAGVLDSAIKSLETFQVLMSGVPMVGSLLPKPEKAYNPEVPLADSLGEMADNLVGLPETFSNMSDDLARVDDNMLTIQGNLETMSDSVGLISKSLQEYQTMVAQSDASMESIATILDNTQTNLPRILNGLSIGLSLFLVWLLVIQVVVFSQGLELYRGTAGHMEGGKTKEVSENKETGEEKKDEDHS